YWSSKNPTRLRETSVKWKIASRKCWKPGSQDGMWSFGKRSRVKSLTRSLTSSLPTCLSISVRKPVAGVRQQRRKFLKTAAADHAQRKEASTGTRPRDGITGRRAAPGFLDGQSK